MRVVLVMMEECSSNGYTAIGWSYPKSWESEEELVRALCCRGRQIVEGNAQYLA